MAFSYWEVDVGDERTLAKGILVELADKERLLQILRPQRLPEIVAAVTTYLIEDMVAAACV